MEDLVSKWTRLQSKVGLYLTETGNSFQSIDSVKHERAITFEEANSELRLILNNAERQCSIHIVGENYYKCNYGLPRSQLG